MAAKPKACPFCGSHQLDATGWKVACDCCGTEGPLGRSTDDAVDLWNTRFGQVCDHQWGTQSAYAAATAEAICLKCGAKPATGGLLKPGRPYLVGDR